MELLSSECPAETPGFLGPLLAAFVMKPSVKLVLQDDKDKTRPYQHVARMSAEEEGHSLDQRHGL